MTKLCTATAILVLALPLAGCKTAPEHTAGTQGEPISGAAPAGNSELRGRITVGGQPVTAAEVAEVIDGKVVAVAPAAPTYHLAAIASCTRATLVVRLSEPVLGAISAPARCGGTLDLDVPADKVVDLTGTIKLPEGAQFDWVELKLTPKLAAVSPTVLLAEGTSPSLREALAVRKLTSATFEQRVVTGSWIIRADRFVDGPPTASAGNLVLDDVKLGDKAVKPQRGSADLELTGKTTVELMLRRDAR
jgi:hypothetical protein